MYKMIFAILNVYLLIFGTVSCQDKYSNYYYPLGFTIIDNDHCELNIQGFTGNTLSLSYKSLPANFAGLNYNTLWLWEASEVPWNYPPMSKKILDKDATESGSYVMEGVEIKINTSYIACYSVDSMTKQISACAILEKQIDTLKNRWVELDLVYVNSNSIQFSYCTLTGYLPKSYNNWFGIWKGLVSPYNLPEPLGIGTPADDTNINTTLINNISIEEGQNYTLIYFLDESETTAATLIRFKISDSI